MSTTLRRSPCLSYSWSQAVRFSVSQRVGRFRSVTQLVPYIWSTHRWDDCMNGTHSEVPAITRIEKLLIQLAVTITVRKCCAVSSQRALTTCRWHVQYLFGDVYWVFSNICVSRVISHSWKRSLRRLTVESCCGAQFRSKTTYVSFCSHRGHVLYNCRTWVDVRIPWIVDLTFPWSVYAVVIEVLCILVRLFVISGLVKTCNIFTETK